MLPLKNRLKLPTPWGKTSPDYQIRTELFKVVGKTFKEDKPTKIGFIISSKVGKATERNRLRRLLAKFFYDKLTEVKSSQEVILIVFPIMAKASNEEINSNLNKVLQKIHI